MALNAWMSIFSLLGNTALSGGFVNCNRLIYVAKSVLARTGAGTAVSSINVYKQFHSISIYHGIR